MTMLKFRNVHGELVDIPQVPATRFKNEFGTLFEEAATGKAVVITKHERPRAVLISYEEFESLLRARSSGLGELEAQFDAMLAAMQTAKSKAGMKAAFEGVPGRKPARAAAKVVRKRKRGAAG
jgi:antitoxin Phd